MSKSDLKEALTKGFSDVEKHVDGQITSLQSEIDGLEAKVKEQSEERGKVEESLQKELHDAVHALEALQERHDALEASGGRVGGSESNLTFEQHMKAAIQENHENILQSRNTRMPVQFETGVKHAVIDTPSLPDSEITGRMGSGVRGGVGLPDQVRDLFPQGSTNKGIIYYVEESSETDNTDTVAEGALKPESDVTFTRQTSPVEKIANSFRVTEESLEDVEWLASYLTQKGRRNYIQAENQQLLYGSGTSPDLQGLLTAGGATAAADNVNAGDKLAVLLDVYQQADTENYDPSIIGISAADWYDIVTDTNADGDFKYPEVVFGGQNLRLFGTEIRNIEALAAGDFFVGNPAAAAMVLDRSPFSVRFYDQDRDNAIKNLVTIVIEKRIAFPIFEPDAVRWGNFADLSDANT